MRYHPERELLGEDYLGVGPGWYGEPLRGLSDLGYAVASDSRFYTCAVETAARALWRRAPTLEEFDDLEALPGVGHKTASVVMSQAFGVPAFPVDTHIHRLAARWGLSSGLNVARTERDLKAIFPSQIWGRMHLAMIYFGRQHCPARAHDLSACPICSWAATRKRIREERRAGAGGPRSRIRGTTVRKGVRSGRS